MIYWLEQIQPSQINLVGDKAFALSQLQQQNYPVIPGFVIATSVYREFLDIVNQNPLVTNFVHSSTNLNVDEYKLLQTVAQELRQQLLITPLPMEWQNNIEQAASQLRSSQLILRPSLNISGNIKADFSGLFNSLICLPDKRSLSKAVKEIWAELFRGKSLFYCQRVGIPREKINFAVLVQPISNAIASGSLKITPHQFQVQATGGLGHAIVKGEVSPDIYILNRETLEIEETILGNKTIAYGLSEIEGTLETYLLEEEEQEEYSLQDEDLIELGTLTENLLVNNPQINTLEWSLSDTSPAKKLYINQANFSFLPDDLSKAILKGLPASGGKSQGITQVLGGSTKHLQNIPIGSIVVIKAVTPDWLPLLKRASGVITEVGGVTSHGAIMARELKIPAVVGVTNATKILNTGESILINGNTGEIFKNNHHPKSNLDEKPLPSESLPMIYYPIGTKLMVNISQTSSIDNAASLPTDGVGLLRGEFMLLNFLHEHSLSSGAVISDKALWRQNLTELLTKFAGAFAPRPIFYRSTDAAQLSHNPHQPTEKGTYHYLTDSSLFDIELEALAIVMNSGYNQVKLILPYVRSVSEFVYCRHKVEQAGLMQHPGFQLWIMAEVPSVLFLVKEYVKAGVQGIAIGTNDLTQLILGTSRDISIPGLNLTHPAMLEVIKQLIIGAKEEGISCSICGQATSDYPEIIDNLIQWGIDIISVEPDALEKSREAIARAEIRLLLQASRHPGF